MPIRPPAFTVMMASGEIAVRRCSRARPLSPCAGARARPRAVPRRVLVRPLAVLPAADPALRAAGAADASGAEAAPLGPEAAARFLREAPRPERLPETFGGPDERGFADMDAARIHASSDERYPSNPEPGTPMRTRTTRSATLLLSLTLLVAAVTTLLSVAPVEAADMHDAWSALEAGDDTQALQHAVHVVETDAVTPKQLLDAALIGVRIGDRDLCDRVRSVGERMEEADDAAEDVFLAVGYAYLGIAEAQLRAQTGGSSTSLLFADAEARGTQYQTRTLGASLLARTHYARGDLPNALTGLRQFAGQHPDGMVGAINLQLGRYLYEHAAALPTQADGRATPEATADLGLAITHLTKALATHARMSPAMREQGLLTLSWTHHRLGHYAKSRSSYLRAHRAGGTTARLARRGLASLYARDAAAHVAALEEAAAQKGADAAALDEIIRLHGNADRFEEAFAVMERRLAAFPEEIDGYKLAASLYLRAKRLDEAEELAHRAIAMDPSDNRISFLVERIAQSYIKTDFPRALATYERLLEARPQDPYSRNNLGFLLREHVSPHTTVEAGAIQRLKPDAPQEIRDLLIRCRDVYAEATALIPEAEDESRDLMTSWNLAGIVNDYALMIHYFADIQDGPLAERLYHRVLRMTEDSFKDTYRPNMQRLYTFVLKDRELTWYRTARRCQDAILREQVVDGQLELIPDEAKRKSAAADVARLRARIVQEMSSDAAEDGAPWPPAGEGGSGR